MPPLTPHHLTLLELADSARGLLVSDAADQLTVTRATAGTYLRSLEHRGLLTAELVDGGRLQYTATADGLIELDRRGMPRSLRS